MATLSLFRRFRSAPAVGRSFVLVLAHPLRLAEGARSRRALRRLDDRLLDDIGLTREAADREAAEPAWNAPLHWFG
jgi:uncharacterized protein YjiS (DUF1127 family)